MKRLAVLIPMVLACSRTPLGSHAPDGGSLGVGGAGGGIVVSSASGGSSGNGGAPPFGDAAPDVVFVTNGDGGPYCGDGVVNGLEECDNGKNDDDYGSTSGCAPGCKLPARCGDGIVQADYGEACDDGSKNVNSTDPSVAYGKCMSNCQHGGWCGDGVVNGPETCDDGVNDGSYRTCHPDCMIAPWCGDGVVQPEYGEECDDGILDGSYGGCTPQCKLGPHCGDSIVNGPEECDHGADNDRDAICTSHCKCIIGCMVD